MRQRNRLFHLIEKIRCPGPTFLLSDGALLGLGQAHGPVAPGVHLIARSVDSVGRGGPEDGGRLGGKCVVVRLDKSVVVVDAVVVLGDEAVVVVAVEGPLLVEVVVAKVPLGVGGHDDGHQSAHDH